MKREPESPGNISSGRATQLRLSEVSLWYNGVRGSVHALNNVDLEIAEGEFVALLGPSGCGKSTLLKIVSGLMPTTSGKVTLAGTEVTKPNSDVGIVFQQATLLPWKTVLENVLVPIRTLGLPLEPNRENAKALLDHVGLGQFLNHYPHELSGGMQQRVGIVRGMIHDPKLLLMDEPFAALDAMTREKMTSDLQRVWMNSNKSVLFITHSISEAIFLADRVAVMSSRPGTIADIVTIDLPRPRNSKTLQSKRYAEVLEYLRGYFKIDEED